MSSGADRQRLGDQGFRGIPARRSTPCAIARERRSPRGVEVGFLLEVAIGGEDGWLTSAVATLRCLPSSPPAAPGLPLPSSWPESPALAVPEGLVGPAGLLGSVEFPAPAGLSILAGLSEPADLPGPVGTGESPASTELASVSAGSDLSILDRLIGVTGRSECSVSARCGVMGWRPGAATLEPTTRLELLLGSSAAMCSLGASAGGAGTGCDKKSVLNKK